MDARFINPVIDAFREILPQLGFADIQRGKLSMGSNSVESLGVTVIIGMTKDLRGSVAYNMSEATAMTIASTMMGGMPGWPAGSNGPEPEEGEKAEGRGGQGELDAIKKQLAELQAKLSKL